MAALPRPRTHYASAAASRWLLPEEILDLLTHAGRLNLQTSGAAPDRPPSGACYLFDRRVCRRFPADGHGWTSRGDSNRVRETTCGSAWTARRRAAAAHAHHAPTRVPPEDLASSSTRGASVLVHYRRVLPREAGARVRRRGPSARAPPTIVGHGHGPKYVGGRLRRGRHEPRYEHHPSVQCLANTQHPPATIRPGRRRRPPSRER